MALAPESLPMVTAIDNASGPPQGNWTYQDYAALPDDGHQYEIVDGVLYMTPSPSRWHQKATLQISRHLLNYVEAQELGEVFAAPFDVELNPYVVVQPDVLLVLATNSSIITDTRIIGAPDLVVEVASPGTAGYDRRQKQNAYARAGVKEYWIVDTIAQTVEVLCLAQHEYQPLGIFQGKVTLPSSVVPGFPVRVEQFFV